MLNQKMGKGWRHAQKLRVIATPSEDPGSGPRTHMVTK